MARGLGYRLVNVTAKRFDIVLKSIQADRGLDEYRQLYLLKLRLDTKNGGKILIILGPDGLILAVS